LAALFINSRLLLDLRFLFHKLQPAPAVFGAAVEQAEEGLLQCAGDRAGGAVADVLAVDRAHRGDLGGGAGHEDLVGAV
jgi:hypothetical protein